MDEAKRFTGSRLDRAMGIVEGLEHLADDRHRHVGRHPLAAAVQGQGQRADVDAEDVLHGQVQPAGDLADLVHVADVPVGEPHDHARLVEEAPDFLVVTLVVADGLEHHQPPDAHPRVLAREKDRAHAALADLLDHEVVPEHERELLQKEPARLVGRLVALWIDGSPHPADVSGSAPGRRLFGR